MASRFDSRQCRAWVKCLVVVARSDVPLTIPQGARLDGGVGRVASGMRGVRGLAGCRADLASCACMCLFWLGKREAGKQCSASR